MKQRWVWIAFALLIALLATLFVNYVVFGDVFNKEESQHALYGLWLYKDLRGLDLGAFWYDTQRQMYWPFLHSWIQSLFFLFFGVSFAAARLMSFVIFLLTLYLMFDVSKRFAPDGWKIGLLAVGLALTSPIMLHYATQNTLEGLGALIFLASFHFYTICEERKLFIEYAILGVLIGLSIYTNYLYAYLMIPAFMLATSSKLGPLLIEGFNLTRKGEKAAIPFIWWAYKKLIVLIILLAFIAVWFFTAAFNRKIMLFLQAIFRYSGGDPTLGVWQSLIFYPLAIIKQYAFSPWLGFFVLLALFKPFVATAYRQVNKMYTFIWTVLVLAIFTVPTKAPQFIYILAPFICLIFAAMVFYWAEKLQKKAAIVMLVLALPLVFSLPRLAGIYFPPRPTENMNAVLNYFRQQIVPRYPIAASFNLQHLNPELITFRFWDWNAPVMADPVIGQAEMFRNAQYFLTVELSDNSPYQAEVLDDTLDGWNRFLADKRQAGEVREFSLRSFPAIGVTAKIYEKELHQEIPQVAEN